LIQPERQFCVLSSATKKIPVSEISTWPEVGEKGSVFTVTTPACRGQHITAVTHEA